MSVPNEDEQRRAGKTARRFFSPAASLQRPGLTGLRALAAMLVVCFHVFAYSRIERQVLLGFLDVTPLITIGWVGVDVFYVLSGFLITIHLAERLERGPLRQVYPGYLRDRILRVVPAYWAQIAVLFALACWLTRQAPPWTHLIPAHLVFAQNFTAGAHSAINGVYWSLPVEFAFYLVAPFVLLAVWPALLDARGLVRRAMGVAVAGLAISITWRILAVRYYGDAGIPTLFWASAAHLPAAAEQFAMGMAAAMVFVARGEPDATRELRWALSSDILVLLGLAGLAGSMYVVDAWVGRYWKASILFYAWHSMASIPIALLVAGVAMRGRLARAIFENAPVVWLGTISYSLYLWHPMIAPYVARAVDAADWSYAGFAAVAIPAFLLASAASYYLVERPFLRLKRRPAPVPRTLQ
jgi:peptidoglycan/LPS O-acetylase OafA/YrhL